METLPAEIEIMKVKANPLLTSKERNRELARLRYQLKKQTIERTLNKLRECRNKN